MKFLLRLFAYPLAASARFLLCCSVRVCVCVLPFCWLFCFVCHIPHFPLGFRAAASELPPSAAFLFSHNFFECGWISAILRCDRQKVGKLTCQAGRKRGGRVGGSWVMDKGKGNRQNVCCDCVCVVANSYLIFPQFVFSLCFFDYSQLAAFADNCCFHKSCATYVHTCVCVNTLYIRNA